MVVGDREVAIMVGVEGAGVEAEDQRDNTVVYILVPLLQITTVDKWL